MRKRLIFALLIFVVLIVAGLFFFFTHYNFRYKSLRLSPTRTLSGWLNLDKQVAFHSYEVLTSHPEESKQYLPVWEGMFKKRNSMSTEYFNSHILVLSSNVSERPGIEESSGIFNKEQKLLDINYHLKINWVQLKLSDTLIIQVGDQQLSADPTKYEEESLALELEPDYMYFANQVKIKPAAHVISRPSLIWKVFRVSPIFTLGFDVNEDLRLTPEGDIVMQLNGTKNSFANQCLTSLIYLESGLMNPVKETACLIY
ncbi:MAG: hypothetical protein A2Z24_00100 [Candidatus Woykebacteria bacterium RBG_16_44_10]|uniref:Uncharacterized protein n=1 Tax=Candidatus Woykebacteria bacterium RBG_16_44_10 TaxID=1802597 RepID=A0A1G1WFT7_9BACT|nr:MAG: hypothetical protein A2Z24_00100 [Candidatus Woykebacteria bacterium RBG_16_44_10]